jgi:hypothetical protein
MFRMRLRTRTSDVNVGRRNASPEARRLTTRSDRVSRIWRIVDRRHHTRRRPSRSDRMSRIARSWPHYWRRSARSNWMARERTSWHRTSTHSNISVGHRTDYSNRNTCHIVSLPVVPPIFTITTDLAWEENLTRSAALSQLRIAGQRLGY